MPAPLSEIAKSFASDASLNLGDRLDDKLRFSDEVVESTAGDGIATRVDHYGGFDEIRGRDTPHRTFLPFTLYHSTCLCCRVSNLAVSVSDKSVA